MRSFLFIFIFLITSNLINLVHSAGFFPCHPSKASPNSDVKCSRVVLPSGLCKRCPLRPTLLDGSFEQCSRIYDTTSSDCRTAISEYVELNPCDTARKSSYDLMMNDDDDGETQLDYFLYSVCEQCCDCIPMGTKKSEYSKLLVTHTSSNPSLWKEDRGNCPSHAQYDVCKVLPHVTYFSKPNGPQISAPKACPILKKWQNSEASAEWQLNPQAEINQNIETFLSGLLNAIDCSDKQIWSQCYDMENKQNHLEITEEFANVINDDDDDNDNDEEEDQNQNTQSTLSPSTSIPTTTIATTTTTTTIATTTSTIVPTTTTSAITTIIIPTVEPVETVVPIITMETVVPIVTMETVVPITTAETVIPITTAETVIPVTTAETVVPIATVESVIPITTSETIVEPSPMVTSITASQAPIPTQVSDILPSSTLATDSSDTTSATITTNNDPTNEPTNDSTDQSASNEPSSIDSSTTDPSSIETSSNQPTTSQSSDDDNPSDTSSGAQGEDSSISDSDSSSDTSSETTPGESSSTNNDSLTSNNSGSLSSATCFPEDAMVQLKSGRSVMMRDLKIGDVVKVSENSFSEVYLFSHRMPKTSSSFVRITTDINILKLTPGHYLEVNGKLSSASTVSIGDVVRTTSGMKNVTAVSLVDGYGLYNPHTVDGSIVVNEIITSTFTTAIGSRTATSLLTPFRALYSLGILTEKNAGRLGYQGFHHLSLW